MYAVGAFVCFSVISVLSSRPADCRSSQQSDKSAKTTTDFDRLHEKAELGDPIAQFQTGLAYETGKGTSQDYAEAARWYRKAADHGDPGAQNNLGGLYSRGLGVPQNDVLAAQWYLRAASEGYPAAENNIGYMFANGRGIDQNIQAAIFWYSKAAEQGYAPAENNLGFIYAGGRGVAIDLKEAVGWYLRAAKRCYAPAEYNLGLIFLNERSIRDIDKALYWLGLAAQHGFSAAANQLGTVYEHGQGVTEDHKIADQWYRLAVKQGSIEAQHNLEVLHFSSP
jgi:uncharacterized protein